MWLKVDRCLTGYDNDMFICACYIIPAGSSAIDNSDVFDKLMNDMTELYGEFGDYICILIGGDFNARTSDKHDYVMHDNEDHLPLPCAYRIDNAVNPRVSKDKKPIRMVILYCICASHRNRE